MSNAPFYLYGLRSGVKLGNQTMVDGVIRDGLWCSFGDVHMGSYAEYTAKQAGVSRERAGRLRARRATRRPWRRRTARASGRRSSRSRSPTGRARSRIEKDESPRADTTLEALAKLKPAFEKDGTVTAGNAPGLNDGASALVVASLAFAQERGLKPLARITAYATGGGEPKDLFFAPIVAVQNLMKKEGKTIGAYDLIEANEAFAVQALADGARPRLGLVPRQRERRRGRARPPDRRQRRAGARPPCCTRWPSAAPRPASPPCASAAATPSPSPWSVSDDPGQVHRRPGRPRPRSRALDLAAVVAGALAVALASQVAVPLPGTPVPMTLAAVRRAAGRRPPGPAAAARRASPST